jgi:L-iditol 2-dehydrogenase
LSTTLVCDVPVPELGAGEVLLRVEACGLCGSDIHAWRSDPGYEWVLPPVVLGHEFAGVVVAVAQDSVGWNVGDRAVAVSIQGCLKCERCLRGATQRCLDRRVIGLSYNGGLSEFVRVSSDYLIRIPSDMEAVVAAAVEPLSVAAHATLTVGGVRSGEKVAVSGAGFVGIACALIAMDAGADVTLIGAERDAVSRLPAAAALGIKTCTTGEGQRGRPDLWIEASGATPALTSAFGDTAPGGRICVVGMYAQMATIDMTLLVRGELEVRGSYASIASDYELVISMLEQGRLPVRSLLEVFNLEDAVDALSKAAESQTLKPIIVP